MISRLVIYFPAYSYINLEFANFSEKSLHPLESTSRMISIGILWNHTCHIVHLLLKIIFFTLLIISY